MEVEKKRSKGGRLNLFDWNGKSRKKLFANESELSASNQGKENAGTLSKSPAYLDVGEKGASSSNTMSNYWNRASSVTSHERCGSETRAPGVVARLMGLESLPSSNIAQPCSTAIFESFTTIPSQYDMNTNDFWSENHIIDYPNMPSKPEKFSSNPPECRAPKKVQNRPSERFHTELWPPKSAKSISIAHHKLLSPIKSPGFIPTKNSAYIMEAAAKIIEASPRASLKSKESSVRPPSVNMRIRDLKEKVETAHRTSKPERPKEASANKCTKEANANKCTKEASLRNKAKSVSLAVQSKINVKSREGSTSCSNRTSINQKEQNEVQLSQIFKSQPGLQKIKQKRTSVNGKNNVLRQNNKKQNSVPNKERSTSQISALNEPDRRKQSINYTVGPNKNFNKVAMHNETESKNLRSTEPEDEKKYPLPKRKILSRKKGDSDALNQKGEKPLKCSVEIDDSMNWNEYGGKKGMDIVSFSFMSPLKRSVIDSFDEHDGLHCSHLKYSESSSPTMNVIHGDALSVLLEQKLQELVGKIQSSESNVDREGLSTSSNLNDFIPTVSPTLRKDDERFQPELCNEKLDSLSGYECSSPDGSVLSVNQQCQGMEEIEEQCTGNSETHLVIEPFCENQICSDDRDSCKRSENWSSIQAQDAVNLSSCETGLFDSCSSTSTCDNIGKQLTQTFTPTRFRSPKNWELKYVRDILSSINPSLAEFASGNSPELITPSLLGHLEIQDNGMTESNEPENTKLERKVLLDCVNECLDLKCQEIVVGSSRAWRKGEILFQRKNILAEEVYKEIMGWKCMEALMVDELVDKDMSTQYGKWVDFDNETFEEGIEIEMGLMTCLVDELVSDLLIS